MINLVLTLLVACASFTLALHQIHFDTTNEDASNLNLDWGRGYLKGHTQAKQSYVQDWSGERQTDDDKELLNVVPLPGAPAAADEEQVANSLDSVAKLATDKTPTFLNVKLSLSLWDNVDRMFTAMLQRARQSPRLTLKDRGTHSVAVMSTIVNLANNLLERCSTDQPASVAPILSKRCVFFQCARTSQYVKSYRDIVSSSLLRAYTAPLEVANRIVDLFDLLRKSTTSVRALVRTDLLRCRSTDTRTRSPCGSLWGRLQQSVHLPQLEREKKLVQALGSLARTVLSSQSLQQTISDFDEAHYLLNGRQDTKLFVLTVKTARVLRLLSNKRTCELPSLGPWLHEPKESEEPHDTAEDSGHAASRNRYDTLAG